MDNIDTGKLLAENQRLRALLKSLEWSGSKTTPFGFVAHCCPCCKSFMDTGHRKDCKLAKSIDGRSKPEPVAFGARITVSLMLMGLLNLCSCQHPSDAFDQMYQELANRNLQQMQARTLQLQRQPGGMP